MIRTLRTRSHFIISPIYRKRFSTTASVSVPERHGLLPTSQSPITPQPQFFSAVSSHGKQLPTYRIIDGVGDVIEGAELPEVSPSSAPFRTRIHSHSSLTNRWRGECLCHIHVPRRMSKQSQIQEHGSSSYYGQLTLQHPTAGENLLLCTRFPKRPVINQRTNSQVR